MVKHGETNLLFYILARLGIDACRGTKYIFFLPIWVEVHQLQLGYPWSSSSLSDLESTFS